MRADSGFGDRMLGFGGMCEPAIQKAPAEVEANDGIVVINAWGREGIAAEVRDSLEMAGMDGVEVENAAIDSYPSSLVLHRDEVDISEAQKVADELGIDVAEPLAENASWGKGHAVTVVVGADYYDRAK